VRKQTNIEEKSPFRAINMGQEFESLRARPAAGQAAAARHQTGLRRIFVVDQRGEIERLGAALCARLRTDEQQVAVP
jgi:hypothetical protein